MAKWEHNLPAVLIPDGEICVNVQIPNHPDYVKLFLRAVRMLETNRLYQRDEGLSAKIVTQQWRDRTITPLIESLAMGNGCPEDMKQFACNSYPAFASFIKYFPDNPYIDGEDVPEGYLLPAWWIWGSLETILPDYIDDIFNGLLEDFTGYKPKDALTWLGSIPISLSWEDFFDIGGIFPRIEIEVTGIGQAKIEFLSFPAGGRVIVELDQMPNIIDILDGGFFDPNSSVIDTDRDIVSFPPEENVINIIPVDVETDGDHTIYCIFLPLINDSVLPIGFGGGIRSVELCGGLRPRGTPEPEPPPPLEGVTELRPEFQFTADCGMEYRLRDQENNIVQDWQPVAGWVDNAAACFAGDEMTCEEVEDCVETSTTIINITNEIAEINETKQAKNIYPPVSVYVDADLCNASKYTADKIISGANDVFTQKNSSNYADWVAASLNTGFGWIATGLQDLWNSVNGAYAATTAELNASSTYLRDILVLNNLNIPNTIVDVLASGSISTAAKSAISKILEATDQSMIAQWAYVGKASNAGGCIATTSWQWKYATHACTYGLPSGWTMSVGASSCGDGPGSADGIYRSRTGVAAENILTINLPSAIQIDSIRANALCNLGAGYTAGTIICTVNNAGVEVFRNSRTMPLTGFVVHNFTPLVIGNQIVIYSVQNYTSVNPTLLCYNNLAVNAALL